jgi:hypothetical protein
MNLSENSYSYVIDSIDKAKRADQPETSSKPCRESSLRFAFGRSTSKRDLDLTLTKIKSIIITQ